jgi:hypothetical protein
VKTSSFFLYTGPGRVSIARYPPRGTPAGFRVFKALAPGAWFNSVGNGSEPVLLCYEKPPFDEANWCHRRLAAQWLETSLGILVPEMDA